MGPSGRSPYQRLGKRPWRYSDLHSSWRSATLRGDAHEAARFGREHSRRYLGTTGATAIREGHRHG